jgi:putative transposase
MPLAPQEIRTFFVTTTSWGRRPIFRAEPMANLFLDTLQHYRSQQKYQLHEFVLMPDHFHALLTPAPDTPLEKAVQLMKGGFSFRVKKELGSKTEIWGTGYTEHRVKDQPTITTTFHTSTKIPFALTLPRPAQPTPTALLAGNGPPTQPRHG